jgi:hypothetical protein
MININIEVAQKKCKTVSVRSLHKITISNSKKISFHIFLKKFQGLFISGFPMQIIPKCGSCLVKSSITTSLCPYSWLLNHHGGLLP